MNSEGKPDPPASLGLQEPNVGMTPLEANEIRKERSSGNSHSHERNGSMSEAFLAAPGYSPSFASLDTNALESHHRPKYSDTFEGFEPPRLSESNEVQETPKVTRPEGLAFTTPLSGYRTPGNFEPPRAEFATPSSIKEQEGEKEADEDFTSPIANLVEKPRSGDPASSSSTPTEVVPAQGNGNSFSFGRVPGTPETPSVQPGNPKNTPALPSPSTPPDLIPALGNSTPFPVSEIHGSHAPQTANEPHAVVKKIPGHELLSSSFTATSTPSTPQTQEYLHGVNGVISTPVIESSSSSSNTPNLQKSVDEVKPFVRKPTVHSTDVAHSTSHEVPLPEDPAMVIPSSEVLESRATESPIVVSAHPTIQRSSDTSNVATVSQEVGDGIFEKPVEHGTYMEGKKEPGNALLQTQITNAPEAVAFRDVKPGKKVSTSASTATPKKGPFLGALKTMGTKKWRGPNDDELRAMVVIPKYLSRDMANAVANEGAANPEGPPAGEKIEAPSCPILVFINSKSGGRLGPELMDHFEKLISPEQVYDLAKHSPAAVLKYGVGCLDKMADSDECARQTRQNLRIIVAGGDGTVGWVLSSVGALRELSAVDPVPPVAVIPLGTGNDLSRSFGWGGDFSSTAKSTLRKIIVKTLAAKAVPLDTWKAVVLPSKSVASEDIKFPHAMKPQQHVPLPSSVAGERHEKDEADPAFEGLFFNYFSVGMDAQVAYGFHHLRDDKPWLARGRTANQMIYSSFGCTQGWFCTACSMAPRSRGVSNILKLSVRRRGSTSGGWEEIHLPSNIRAVVICNLKSYAGGRNIWGKPSSSKSQKKGLEEQRPDDGLLEVMGLKDGWHSAFVLLEVSSAVHLCQAEAIKLELTGRARTKAYLQMDGEPWMQPMGVPDDKPTVVIIDKLPTPSMLLKR